MAAFLSFSSLAKASKVGFMAAISRSLNSAVAASALAVVMRGGICVAALRSTASAWGVQWRKASRLMATCSSSWVRITRY
ncbi:hypothetical protein amb2532 [Paramagnetospirillum magneticum AMB-1]|uniref:Uncharacterized protein n=1 Tax=Paramagnetospirillum magneticum (strain ATCC 700264 / AMB-1) TaxID=342108 RepID=Q2W489_PARM1|nr:hypothetical protein amb2532 [Paramagnetospirillum magneticum AMB-1]